MKRVKIFSSFDICHKGHIENIRKDYEDWLNIANIQIIETMQSFHDRTLIITVIYDDLE